MAKIEINNLCKSFQDTQGESLDVLVDVNLEIAAGEFLCLLGPSGCGKTTLMNLMAGFEKPTQGTLTIDGLPVSRPDPKHITIFQDYGLFPWRNVLGNVVFGLEAKGMNKKAAKEKAEEYLELVGLSQFSRSFPGQLSGGMKQRVAIARALAVEPDIIFMDEPFAALDAFTRYRLQDEVLRIWAEKKPTIIFVTHDIDEAVYLAQRLAIMTPNPGRIQRIIDIKLPRPCNRGDAGLVAYRQQVFQEFELVHAVSSDYSI
ncbi:ABC transporter ATP-binding protein [Sporomusa sp.]|uniref:ABC transporter ATP-binding protein n=1 Tax=Sporomusa sp. TaxID=2078658 RepID=UPI002C4689B4|nr:ABC transporter ATP-binding protein [Sporomusa sp.]HWR06477.1 ABC transporter ATP-binding protein [Sporomusa sp.]